MRSSTKFVVLVGAVLSAACGAEAESELEETVSSTEAAALITPAFSVSDDSWADRFFVVYRGCPSSKPYLVGLGFEGMKSGISDAYFTKSGSDQWDKTVAIHTQSHIEGLGVQAICSNFRPTKRVVEASGGDATAHCNDNEVAVGGGASCDDFDAFLYRSRPNPDANGSEPTGWRASCSRGAVKTYVMCRDRDTTYDLTDCNTKRAEGQGEVTIACDPGYYAISGGGYCGTVALESVHTTVELADQTYKSIHAECRGPGTPAINGYAICCRRAQQ